MKNTENKIMVKPYMLCELSNIYGISSKTMSNWLKPFEKQIGFRNGRYYNVKQVTVIFNNLGVPFYMEN